MYLAENRLSSDFCDWSEVTDGLLGDTWKQEVKTALDKKRRLWHLHYFFSRGHGNRPHGLPWWYLSPYTTAALSLQVKRFFLWVCLYLQLVLTVIFKRSRQCLSIHDIRLSALMKPLTSRVPAMSIISCFTSGSGAAASLGTKQINNARPAGRFTLKPLGGGQRMRRSSVTECAMCWTRLPSAKLYLSQLEEEGVLQGETPSSASIREEW